MNPITSLPPCYGLNVYIHPKFMSCYVIAFGGESFGR